MWIWFLVLPWMAVGAFAGEVAGMYYRWLFAWVTYPPGWDPILNAFTAWGTAVGAVAGLGVVVLFVRPFLSAPRG